MTGLRGGFTRTKSGRTWGSAAQREALWQAILASARARRKHHMDPQRFHVPGQEPGYPLRGTKKPEAPKPKGRGPDVPRMPRYNNKAVTEGGKLKASGAPRPMHGSGQPWTEADTRTAQHRGHEITIVHDVAQLSTEADFSLPENVNKSLSESERQQARFAADEMFKDAVRRAPDIREAFRRAAKSHGGEMAEEFWDNAPTTVKTAHSTYRKIQKKVADSKGTDKPLTVDQVKLADTVRGTAAFSEKDYVAGVQGLQEELAKIGYTMTQPPPHAMGAWALGPYRGLNMNFRSDDGFEFELQVHTYKSLEVKGEAHKYYDIIRANDDQLSEMMADPGEKGAFARTGIDPEGKSPAEYKMIANEIMMDLAETIPIPKGVSVLAGKDQWNNVIQVTPATGLYSARPVPEGATSVPRFTTSAAETLAGRVRDRPNRMDYNQKAVSSGSAMKGRAPRRNILGPTDALARGGPDAAAAREADYLGGRKGRRRADALRRR